MMVLLLLAAGPMRADITDVTWSTFLGGSSSDIGYGVAVDHVGHAYVTGQTLSSDFPKDAGAYDTSFMISEAFVVKFSANGSALEYATFLGGSSLDDGFDIAVDEDNKAHVTGTTWSNDFPTRYGSLDTTFNGFQDVFVVKLNATGSAVDFSTYLGGTLSDIGYGIDLDDQGNVYVVGQTGSSDFPHTSGTLDTSYNGGNKDIFVSKMNSAGNALVYSTFLGGSVDDEGRDVTVDGTSGTAFLVGYSNSLDFPTAEAFKDTNSGDFDVVVAKLNPEGTALSYSTYLGADFTDYGYGIAVDDSGQAHVAGETNSSEFHLTPGAYDTSYSNGEAFAAKLNATGNGLCYSTLLGGDQSDIAYGISLDLSQQAFIIGLTRSTVDFPLSVGAYDLTHNGDDDAFIIALSVTGDSLEYGTYLGGNSGDWGQAIAIDEYNSIFLTGQTSSSNFPTTSGAYDTLISGGDAFLVKMNLAGGDAIPPQKIEDLSITLENFTKGGDIRLTWTEPFDNIDVGRYVIHRSTSTAVLGDSLAGTTDTTYLDTGAVGDPDSNYVYAVRAVDTSENKSAASNQVGEYDNSLQVTTGTDYTWISVCLGGTGLVMASDLEAHIEANSSPACDCYTISEWNSTAQNYTTYTTIPIPLGDFALEAGHAYRVEVSTNSVWTQVGDVLPSDSVSFDLSATTGTDYTWISIPMHLATLDSTSDLEAHIEANSSPACDCYTISEWNSTAQNYTTYTTIPFPIGNYSVTAGKPYRVEVNTNTVWP
jgi:hypothetical protein